MALCFGFPDVRGQGNERWQRQGPVPAAPGSGRAHNAVVVSESQSLGSGKELSGRPIEPLDSTAEDTEARQGVTHWPLMDDLWLGAWDTGCAHSQAPVCAHVYLGVVCTWQSTGCSGHTGEQTDSLSGFWCQAEQGT